MVINFIFAWFGREAATEGCCMPLANTTWEGPVLS